MSKIKAIIFDMDGVLIDAKDWHYHALNKALALFGMEISRYEHVASYDGLPTMKKLEMLSIEKGLPRKLHPFINKLKQQYTLETVFSECRPVFYHLFALSQLKALGYRLAVCSNSIRKTIEIMMEKAQLIDYLEFFLSNQDVHYPKPHPEIYQKAIAKLDLLSSECLIIEDNFHGIKAANDSGAHVMAVLGVEEVNLTNILKTIQHIEKEANQGVRLASV